MSLKSIRANYSKLLNTFSNANVAINESQKAAADEFVLDIESQMSKQRKSAILKTKKVVTEKLEKEFKSLFESVMEKMQENASIAAKIQALSIKLNESKKIATNVDKYLDMYVESILPKKTIIDFDRMQKLEKIHESLKDLLVVNDDAVESKMKALEESYKSKKSKCETEVAKVNVKLEESKKKNAALQCKLDSLKAVELLESKTKYLPDFEAHAMKKRLCESTVQEIEKKFDKTLEAVREDAKKVAADEETTLDEEISKIVGEAAEAPKAAPAKKRIAAAATMKKAEEKKAPAKKAEDAEELDEDFETMETVKYDEDGSIRLDDSDVIDESLMRRWCMQSYEVL